MKATLSDDGKVLTLSGALRERDQLGAVAAKLAGEVRVNARALTPINSAGVKQWLSFIRAVAPGVKLVFFECPVSFVHHLNTVRDFVGSATVESVLVPWLCPRCSASQERLVTRLGLDAALAAPPQCGDCFGAAALDVPPDEYFAFWRQR